MTTPTPPVDQKLVERRERVRNFIYDCTKDEFNTGWTLSAHQTDDLIKIALTPTPPVDRLRDVIAEQFRDFLHVHGIAPDLGFDFACDQAARAVIASIPVGVDDGR